MSMDTGTDCLAQREGRGDHQGWLLGWGWQQVSAPGTGDGVGCPTRVWSLVGGSQPA